MLNLNINNCDLSLGINAGTNVYNDILRAQKNVLVVSSHVSEESIDLMLKKHVQGVNVMLITSTDFEGESESKGIYKKLITQSRHINESKKRYRLIGLVLMYATIIGSMVSTVAGILLNNFTYFWPLIALPIGFLFVALLNKLQVYKYKYIANMPFHVVASPYRDPNTSNQVFINSKIYIVDDEIAYLGSANFTQAGFEDHYESMFRILDRNAVSYLYQEINRLITDQNRLFRDINFIGKHIYPEPIN